MEILVYLLVSILVLMVTILIPYYIGKSIPALGAESNSEAWYCGFMVELIFTGIVSLIIAISKAIIQLIN